MINIPFPSEFYTVFPAPNADELISVIDEVCNTKQVDNDFFEWGKLCKVDRIPLLWQDFIDLYRPSMDIFCKKFNKDIKYTMYNPWINLYKRGYYQEIHDHAGHDISSVFFVNNGVDFGKFFFMDRHSCNFSDVYEDLISYSNQLKPNIKKGDIIFFSSHLLHGVSSHENDDIRKTLSVNFNLNIVN